MFVLALMLLYFAVGFIIHLVFRVKEKFAPEYTREDDPRLDKFDLEFLAFISFFAWPILPFIAVFHVVTIVAKAANHFTQKFVDRIATRLSEKPTAEPVVEPVVAEECPQSKTYREVEQ